MDLRAAIAPIIIAALLSAAPISASGQTAPLSRTVVQLRATLSGHKGRIIEFAFSPNGETVATGSEDGTVHLWNTRTGELNATLKPASKYRWLNIVWSPDGRAIALVGDGNDERLQIWDVRTAKMKTYLATRNAYTMTWSADGRMLLITSFGEKVAKLWDAETGSQLATFEQDPPCPKKSFWKALVDGKSCTDFSYVTAHFDAAGHSVITASRAHHAKLWDVATGKLKTTLPLRGEEFAERLYQSDVVISPDHRLIARYIHNELALLDSSTGEVKRTLGQIGLPIAFSPDSQTLLTTIRQPATGTLGKWDEFKLYDVATGQLRLTFERVRLIAFRDDLHWSRDGHTILVGSGGAVLLDARTGKVKGSIKYDACVPDRLFGDSGCQPFILNADGRVVIKVTNPVRLWSADNGALIETLDTAHAPALFSPTDPGLLITRAQDKKTALLWKVLLN